MPGLKLADLQPQFMKRLADDRWQSVESIEEADGIEFLCPKCWRTNGGPRGTHAVICWSPSVPQTTSPKPGRWSMSGTGYQDLTLSAKSSSVQLTGGCRWHGFVRNGEVTDA